MAWRDINLTARSTKILYLLLCIGLLSGFFFSYGRYPFVRDELTGQQSLSASSNYQQSSIQSQHSKYAYVTLLAVDRTPDPSGDIFQDKYFVGLRILAYQLLHAKETRSHGIPFVVMAVRGASQAKKDRLAKDGATILEIDPVLVPEWMPEAWNPAWVSMFDKLRMWELTQFERLIFLDADVIVARPLDGAFESAIVQKSDASKGTHDVTSGLSLPEEYVFVAGMETTVSHHFPPTLEGGDFERGLYVNAGFMILQPSQAVFQYYLSVLEIPSAFSIEFMEQDLLNFVHRLDGPMPWQQLDSIWNIHRPQQEDLDAGVHSVHGKWWNAHHRDIMPWMASWRWRMEGFFQAWDELHAR